MLTRRTLGTQGLTVSSLGLGLMGMYSLWERNLEPRIIPLVPDIAPIPGTKHRKYLEENVGATDVALSAAEMDALDAALSPEKVPGPATTRSRRRWWTGDGGDAGAYCIVLARLHWK